MQDRVATTLWDLQKGAIGVAHQPQLAAIELVQRAVVVSPVQLVSLAVEVDGVLLDGILPSRRRRTVTGRTRRRDDAEDEQRCDEEVEGSRFDEAVHFSGQWSVVSGQKSVVSG